MQGSVPEPPKQKCHFYHNVGYCSAGDACRFAHEDTVRNASDSLAAMALPQHVAGVGSMNCRFSLQDDSAWDPASAAVNTAFVEGGYADNGTYAAEGYTNSSGYTDDSGYGEEDYGDGSEGYNDEAGAWVSQGNWQNGNGSSYSGGNNYGYAPGGTPQQFYGGDGGGGVRYKRVLCDSFMATGVCRRGFGYAHGRHELVRLQGTQIGFRIPWRLDAGVAAMPTGPLHLTSPCSWLRLQLMLRAAGVSSESMLAARCRDSPSLWRSLTSSLLLRRQCT